MCRNHQYTHAVIGLLFCMAVFVLIGPSAICHAASNQFVIVSDLHPSKEIVDQLERVTEEVLEINPAFVIQLGDVGNDSFPGGSVWQMKVIDATFRKWREAGIEIHISVGNHDVPPKITGVAELKRNWFASQLPPYPMNAQLDAEKNPDIWERYCLEGQYYYSFTWRGIHFVLMDSNDVVPRDDGGYDVGPRQRTWLVDELCNHKGNPSKYPSLVFLHDTKWIGEEQKGQFRPLYNVLKENPDGHTVKAVFGGHAHYGRYWPPEVCLGAHVYTVPASVLKTAIHHPPTPAYTEFILATVTEDEITFEKRTINPPGGKRAGSKVVFHPVLTDLVYHPIPLGQANK